MMMNNLPAIVIDNLPDYLITKLIMFNCHPRAAIIQQAVEYEYKDENRQCAIIGRREVFIYSISNVNNQEYNYSEQAISYYMHEEV